MILGHGGCFKTLHWWSLCTLYLFICLPGESYFRKLRSLLLCLFDICWMLIIFFECWFCKGTLGLILFNVNVNHTGDFLFDVYSATVNLHCEKIKRICLLLQIINAHVLLHEECRRYSLWLNDWMKIYIGHIKTSTQNLACSQHHVNDASLSGGNILWPVSYCCVQNIHFETGYWHISLDTEDVYFVMGYPQITVQKRYFVTSYWQISLHRENVHFVI